MLREVSRGAWSFCILLPQYRGRNVSQTRNTHGISKALQYLKTHRRRLASQHSAKKFPPRCTSCPKGRCQRLDWTAIVFCWRAAWCENGSATVQNGPVGIARLGDVRYASAVFVGRTGLHFWTKHIEIAARLPNLKTPIWSISARDPLCHHEFCRCLAKARDAIASVAAGLKGAEGNGH